MERVHWSTRLHLKHRLQSGNAVCTSQFCIVVFIFIFSQWKSAMKKKLYCSRYQHKLPGRPPPSHLCTHRSLDWLHQYRFCRMNGILQEEVKLEFKLQTAHCSSRCSRVHERQWCVVFVLKHTCAQGEGVIPHFAEVAVDAVQAELPFVAVVTAALAVPSTGPIAVAHPVSMTRSVRAPHTGFREWNHEDGTNVKIVQFLRLLKWIVNVFYRLVETESVSSSPLQSGPNVPLGQHTLIVSMQNHLCRSGCFVFLKEKDSKTQTGELSDILDSETII